ncbi:hypothetical protein MKW92_020553 [Papaver armeniacum]|nr:hypothetical protein MKW92_020553 [Papaver armeniacum]
MVGRREYAISAHPKNILPLLDRISVSAPLFKNLSVKINFSPLLELKKNGENRRFVRPGSQQVKNIEPICYWNICDWY